MKCPSCQHEPISFQRWVILFDPVHLTCKHCSTKLLLTPRWRTQYHVVSILVSLLIIVPVSLSLLNIVTFSYLREMYIYGGVLVILVLMGLSAYFWNRFEYKQDE